MGVWGKKHNLRTLTGMLPTQLAYRLPYDNNKPPQKNQPVITTATAETKASDNDSHRNNSHRDNDSQCKAIMTANKMNK